VSRLQIDGGASKDLLQRSQAIRLPKSCCFPDGQRGVLARRVGRNVILEPADEWSAEFMSALGGWLEPIERPKPRPIAKKKDPFV
jgi:virulence-associated protein VagC